MLNNFFLIISHLGCPALDLIPVFNETQMVQLYHTNTNYNHPNKLINVLSTPHKHNFNSGIHGDICFNNISISSKSIYTSCKFIYIVNNPKYSLNKINLIFKSEENSINHYFFRLRRMLEMSIMSKGLYLRWDQIVGNPEKSNDMIKEYLEITENLNLQKYCQKEEIENTFSFDVLKQANEKFEKYNYLISKTTEFNLQ